MEGQQEEMGVSHEFTFQCSVKIKLSAVSNMLREKDSLGSHHPDFGDKIQFGRLLEEEKEHVGIKTRSER